MNQIKANRVLYGLILLAQWPYRETCHGEKL